MHLAPTGKPSSCLIPTLNPDFMELCSVGSYCPTVLAKPVTLLSKKINSQLFETWQTKNQLLLIFLLSAKGKGKNQQCLSKVWQLLCLPNSYPLTQLLKTSWFSSIKHKIKETRRAAASDFKSCSQVQALHPSHLCPAPPFLQLLTHKSERGGDSAWKSSYLDHHLKGEDSCEYIIQVFQSLNGRGKCVLGKATHWNNLHRSKVKQLI